MFDVVELLLLAPQSLSCCSPLHILHMTPLPAHIEALGHLQRQQLADEAFLQLMGLVIPAAPVCAVPSHLATCNPQQQADLAVLAEQAQAHSSCPCGTMVRLPICSRGETEMADAMQGWHTTCLCQTI